MPVVLSGVSGNSEDSGWDNETKDPDKVKLCFLVMSGHWTSVVSYGSNYTDSEAAAQCQNSV